MSSQSEDVVAIDVQMSTQLATDIDAYAATRGYLNPDAVVREALARQE